MPLPEKFYNMNDEEVTLEQLCHQEPGWAANRIRHLTQQIDSLMDVVEAVRDCCNCVNGMPRTSAGCPVHGLKY